MAYVVKGSGLLAPLGWMEMVESYEKVSKSI